MYEMCITVADLCFGTDSVSFVSHTLLSLIMDETSGMIRTDDCIQPNHSYDYGAALFSSTFFVESFFSLVIRVLGKRLFF